MKGKLILALDLDTGSQALEMVKKTIDFVEIYKVGMQLFTSTGPQIVKDIVSIGGKVFLDLKFHDIPSIVSNAIKEAVKLGVYMIDVHTSGGSEMLRQASMAVTKAAKIFKVRRPYLLGITVLTSLNEEYLQELGINGGLEHQVGRLAMLAKNSGLEGVVASVREIETIKRICGQEFIVVTPGIRQTKLSTDDQQRTATAYEAAKKGADFLVVGRPVLKAPQPEAVVRDIQKEIAKALSSR